VRCEEEVGSKQGEIAVPFPLINFCTWRCLVTSACFSKDPAFSRDTMAREEMTLQMENGRVVHRGRMCK